MAVMVLAVGGNAFLGGNGFGGNGFGGAGETENGGNCFGGVAVWR